MSEAKTAQEALSNAMRGCEDGYSWRDHEQVVADTLARIDAAGWAIVRKQATGKAEPPPGWSSEGEA